MPQLEPKAIQKELDAGRVRPFYWLYGDEPMKARELVKRIKSHVLGTKPEETPFIATHSLNEELLDGASTTGPQVADAALSLALGGGTRIILVRDAHLLPEPEALESLMGEATTRESLPQLVICLSQNLDKRKKFTKQILAKAVAVPCEAVAESEREPWIQYLAKRHGLALKPEWVQTLRTLDPWTLDIVERELEKLELMIGDSDAGALLSQSSAEGMLAERFLDALFSRRKKDALALIDALTPPDESLPLLGLLGWNVRHLALGLAAREKNLPPPRISPYLAEKFTRWSKHWTLAQMLSLQDELSEMDFSFKQTPRLPLGIWMGLIRHI